LLKAVHPGFRPYGNSMSSNSKDTAIVFSPISSSSFNVIVSSGNNIHADFGGTEIARSKLIRSQYRMRDPGPHFPHGDRFHLDLVSGWLVAGDLSAASSSSTEKTEGAIVDTSWTVAYPCYQCYPW
jgi:hypothetical protein